MLPNYFNYFTEIEERFQKRRGTATLLSTLDWALIETWKDAGIPIEAVLRGIDAAFDAYDRKPARAKARKVNSLAYCAQEVLAAATEIKEAGVGAERTPVEPAMPSIEVAAYLEKNAGVLEKAVVADKAREVVLGAAASLRELAAGAKKSPILDLESLERHLTVLEEKLFAALFSAASEKDLVDVRTEAERELALYRSKMTGAQIEQLLRQFTNKRLLERAKLPRLSLFYM